MLTEAWTTPAVCAELHTVVGASQGHLAANGGPLLLALPSGHSPGIQTPDTATEEKTRFRAVVPDPSSHNQSEYGTWLLLLLGRADWSS